MDADIIGPEANRDPAWMDQEAEHAIAAGATISTFLAPPEHLPSYWAAWDLRPDT